MSHLEDRSLLLTCSPRPWLCDITRTGISPCSLRLFRKTCRACAHGHERRIHSVFQPMPMRRPQVKRGLTAEEFVALAPKPGEASIHAAAPFYAEEAFGNHEHGPQTT